MTQAALVAPRSKRTEIIKAASDLFAYRGYDGTSMDMIAEAANVSRQTIYNQFESKEALFQALVDQLVGELIAPLGKVAAGSSLRETLNSFAEHALEFVLRPKTLALHRLVIGSVGFPDFGRTAYDAGPARAYETLAMFLRDQARLGRLELEDPILAAVHFFALVTRDSEFKALFGKETHITAPERRRRAHQGVDVFLRAYGKTGRVTALPGSRRKRRSIPRV
jgi:TetR/AcrR family transcriptional repressor of mexJK operon